MSTLNVVNRECTEWHMMLLMRVYLCVLLNGILCLIFLDGERGGSFRSPAMTAERTAWLSVTPLRCVRVSQREQD